MCVVGTINGYPMCVSNVKWCNRVKTFVMVGSVKEVLHSGYVLWMNGIETDAWHIIILNKMLHT